MKTSGSPIIIKSDVDLASARDAITSFVTTYNDIYASLQDLRTGDPSDEDKKDNLLRYT